MVRCGNLVYESTLPSSTVDHQEYPQGFAGKKISVEINGEAPAGETESSKEGKEL